MGEAETLNWAPSQQTESSEPTARELGCRVALRLTEVTRTGRRPSTGASLVPLLLKLKGRKQEVRWKA